VFIESRIFYIYPCYVVKSITLGPEVV